MMELQKKKCRSDRREAMATARDFFGELPIELIQTILSFLINPPKKLRIYNSSLRFEDTKEAVKTIILSKRFLHAWSTFPDIYLSHLTFSKLPNHMPVYTNQKIEEFSMAREKFANYVLHTVTRYQQHNIPITTLRLTVRLQDDLPPRFTRVEDDDRIANILEQSIRKAKENGVKEVYMHMVSIRPCNLLQTIFALKQLVSLCLYRGDLVKKDVLQNCDDIFINCSSLRMLKLDKVGINEDMLQKIIKSCPLIEEINLDSCKGIETIQIANLPNLKRLNVFTHKNQIVDINLASLELMEYGQDESSPYALNIGSSQNMKILKLEFSCITDAHLHSLIAKCPVLEELTLTKCDAIQKISISSHSLSFLSIITCLGLIEVKIDAPMLNMFDYYGVYDYNGEIPSLVFANGLSEKRKSIVSLTCENLAKASSFLQLSKFLMAFKHSDAISLLISTEEEISFDKNIMNGLRDQNNIPEFDEVYITMNEEFTTVSSQCSTLMEGLLWSFSPKIISVTHDSKADDKFITHLCEELLVEHDDRCPDISSTPSNCWRNYFKQAKFKDRDDEWRPLHSWKSLADVLKNLEVKYILNLSHD